MGLAPLRSSALAPALLAAALGCGPAAPARPAEVLQVSVPPRAPADRTWTDREPTLRLVAPLEYMGGARFLRDAGLIVSGSWEDARVLRDSGTLVPAEDFVRFADGTTASFFHLYSQSGPWPKEAWMGGWFGPFDGREEGALLRWTDAGWDKVIATENYRYIGLGRWLGGRLITPDIRMAYVEPASPNDSLDWRLTRDPKIVVLEGEPSDELPELERDSRLMPRAFASLPSGHAFLLYERSRDDVLVAHRWSPGERRSVKADLPGLTHAAPVNGSRWMFDPTREILAAAPDDVYVFAHSRGTALPRGTAFAHWNGSGWDVSWLSELPFVTHARGPDGTLWLVCAELSNEAPVGELWRRSQGGAFERVALPRAPMNGQLVEVAPKDVWPRGADELWVIADFNPHGKPFADTGLFLLDLPERPAAPPARR